MAKRNRRFVGYILAQFFGEEGRMKVVEDIRTSLPLAQIARCRGVECVSILEAVQHLATCPRCRHAHAAPTTRPVPVLVIDNE